jgi:cytochrome P450
MSTEAQLPAATHELTAYVLRYCSLVYLDPPAHTRLRSLASQAFSPARVEVLRSHIREIVSRLLDHVQAKGRMDIIGDLAEPLPSRKIWVATCWRCIKTAIPSPRIPTPS